MNQAKEFKAIVIGSGPAGYTAAIYLSRANIPNLLSQKNRIFIDCICVCLDNSFYLIPWQLANMLLNNPVTLSINGSLFRIKEFRGLANQ